MNNRDIFIQEYPAHSSRTVQLADGGMAYPYSALAVGRIEGLYRSLPALMSDDATDKDNWYVVNIDDDTTNGHIQAVAVLGATSEDQAKSWAIKTIGVYLNASPRAWHIAISSAKALKNFLDRSASRGSFAISQTMLDTIAKQITDTPVKWLSQESCQLTSHNGNTSELLHELVKQDDAAQLVDSMNSADLACLLAELGAEEEDYNAIIVQYAKFDDFINRMNQAMGKAAVNKLSIANFTKTKPFKRNNVVNIALLWDLSDGQSMTIVFHNPDSTPSKLQAGDVLTSWKFMLNKRDITAAVSPEQGKNAQPTIIAQRMMLIAEKNSARFVRTNAKKDEKVKALSELELANENTQNEIARILAQNEALQNEIDAVVANRSEPSANNNYVSMYLTSGGYIGMLIKKNVGSKGQITYSYEGKWGAGSGHSYEQMLKIVNSIKASKRGVRLKEGTVDFEDFKESKTTGKLATTQELVQVALSRKDGNKAFVELGEVTTEVAQKIKAATGEDVTGWVHGLDEAGIRHVLEKHGDVAYEEKRGQVAVSSADFDKLPLVLGEPDTVSKGDVDNTVMLTKKIGDEVFVIQELRVGRKKLTVKTMYKKPLSAPVAPVITQSTAEASETFGEQANQNIAQPFKNTNPDRDYLQSIIDGKADLSNADEIESKLTDISDRLNAELEPLFEQAAEVFAQYAIAQAATV